LLEKKVIRCKEKFDLIIAHSYSSLYPAYKLAKKHHIPFAFDIEDYHPGETCSPKEKKRREFLMRKMLPNAAYITYASPLIGKYSFDLLKGIEIPPHILINNCFLQNEFDFKQTNSDKIQLVWFSQNIAEGRGLELVVPVLYQFKELVQLNLVGNLYPQFYNDFLAQYADILKITEPMPQAGLNKYICSFDIGLAIEQKASDFNRDICLTNKIFAYAQAGLYILATNTSAQKLFMEEHAGLGVVSGQSSGEMEITISNLIANIEIIRKEKQARYEYAKKLSWESESQKLAEIWAKILNCKSKL
jgi:glycosyltransferase involved in cell wall biosynthesis